MNILLASSEVFPYSKTGGLADMVGALSKALAVDGHTVRVITPLYRGLQQKHPLQRTDISFSLPLGATTQTGILWMTRPADGLTLYFVEHTAFFDRSALYGEAGRDYPDNAARFIFFSKAVAHLSRVLPNPPELVHVHDWQAGLVPLFIRQQQLAFPQSKAPATLITIHNLAYQGVFPYSDYSLTNLPTEYFNPEGLEFHSYINCLKAGIVYSDLITTVSPRYAREITTEQFGCGLDGVLRARQDRLV